MSEQFLSPNPTSASATTVRTRNHVLKAGILKGSYGDNPNYKQRVARHLRRKSGRQADYFARSFSGENYILRAFTVFHRALAVEKGNRGLGLTFRSLLFLMIAKQYLTVKIGGSNLVGFAPLFRNNVDNKLFIPLYH